MPVGAANWNVTTTSMTNTVDPGMLFFLVVIMAGVIGLMLIITSIQRYTTLMNYIEKWFNSLKYTVYGTGVATVGYVLYIICGLISQAGSAIDPIWIAYAIGGYAGLTVLGWVAAKIVNRIKAMHSEYKASKKLGRVINPE